MSEIPFDINDQRTIEYTDDMAGACHLKSELRKKIDNIKFEEAVENPVTLALEKKNLVNVPENMTQDFVSMILQLQDDMSALKRDISMMREDKRNFQNRIYFENPHAIPCRKRENKSNEDQWERYENFLRAHAMTKLEDARKEIG